MKPVPEIFFGYQYLRAKDIILFKQVGVSIDELNLADRGKKLPCGDGIEFFGNRNEALA